MPEERVTAEQRRVVITRAKRCCEYCHSQMDAVPLFNPRQQLWQEHFAWNADYTIVIGLTSVGRATITVLHLNRQGLMNLRRALFALGAHPLKRTLS